MKFKLIENLEDLFEAKRPNLAVEEMKDVLARNDDQVGKALVKLYELQTEDEKASGSTHKHNSVGFNVLDAEILSNFAEFYMKHHRLTPKQLVIARKKIMKYAEQLVNIANSTTIASDTNSEKSTQVVLTLDMLEDLRLNESKSTSLSAGDINNIRNVIHHKLGIPTAGMRIQPNGRFEFTNISESDAIKISRGLERFDLASNIYQTKGAIDFNHFTPMGKPKNKFNVTGELNLDKFLEENLAKINEASVSEDYVNYNANPQGRNEGDCTIRALSLAYNLSYANVKSDLISLGNKNKSKFNTFPTINAFMEKHRFKKYLNNEDGSINVSTVENFAKKYHHGNYVVRCSDRSKQDMSHAFHLVAVIDGKIYDTWDSADYFVIDAWEVAGNSKRILNTKGIKESVYGPASGKFINLGGQSIKSIKAYGLGNIDNPEQIPIPKKSTKISKDSGKHEENLLQFAQRIHDKKYSDFSKNRKKSPIDLYDRFITMLSAMDLYTIATKLPEYKLLHTPNIIPYTNISVDNATGYIKVQYQNDAELKASTALADFYDIPYTIKKDVIIFKILPDNESWD